MNGKDANFDLKNYLEVVVPGNSFFLLRFLGYTSSYFLDSEPEVSARTFKTYHRAGLLQSEEGELLIILPHSQGFPSLIPTHSRRLLIV